MPELKEGWIAITHCGICGAADAKKLQEVYGVDVLSCNECGAIRVSAVQDPEAVYFDGYHEGDHWGIEGVGEEGWDYTSPLAIAYERFNSEKRLQFLEKFTKPGKLLDVGGGVGTFALVAKEHGWDAAVMEPVKSAIDYVEGIGLKGIVGGIEDLETLEEKYNVISMLHVLEHLPEPRESLEMCRKFLPSGGLVFIEVPHWDAVPHKVSGEKWIGWRVGQHIHHFTKSSLKDVFERAGLEPVSIRTFVQLWDGLIPQYYAYLVGAEGFAKAVAGAKRAITGKQKGEKWADTKGMPAALKDQPMMKLLFKPPMMLAGKVQEMLGLAENIRAVARVP